MRGSGADTWRTADIASLNDWLAATWEQSLLQGGAAGRRHLLSPAQVRHAGDRITGTDRVATGTRRLMSRGWQIARDWQISTRELAAGAFNPDTRAFADWAVAFEAMCDEQEWVDPASLIPLLLPELAQGAIRISQPIVLAGFTSIPPALGRLCECLSAQHLLAGQLTPDNVETLAVRSEYADTAAERSAAANWARSVLETQPDGVVGIIVPELHKHAGDFRRTFLDAFDPRWREYDSALLPIDIDDGANLADTGLVQTALLLLQVPGGRMDYREFGQLLRSPYLDGAAEESAARAGLDLWIREQALQAVDLREIQGRAETDDLAKLGQVLGGTLTLGEQFRGRREPSDWVTIFERVFKAAGFARGRTLSRTEERILEQWQHLIEQFASFAVITGPIDAGRARSVLAAAAREQPLNSSGRTAVGTVQILSPQDAEGHKFDALWIAGLTSEVWPPVAHPNPLLPLHLQRDRGVPEAVPRSFREISVGILDRLLRSAPAVRASWAARSDAEEQTGCPLIAALPIHAPDNFGAASSDYRQQMFASAAVDELDIDPAPPIGASETVRGGSSLMNLQSACPARAFFEIRLGAREMRSPPFALDALGRGNLIHTAVEYLYRELEPLGGPSQASATVVDELIAGAIDVALNRHIPERHPLVTTLRVNEGSRLKNILLNIIERDRERPHITVLGQERAHTATIAGLPLSLRVDRIDQSADGGRLIIDYKSGARFATSKWQGNRPLELQMPLYAATGNADGIALFWLHSDRLRIDGIASESFDLDSAGGGQRTFRVIDKASWDEQVATWSAILEELGTEFSAGDCRIDLAEDAKARGEFAMLTRRFDLQGGEDE